MPLYSKSKLAQFLIKTGLYKDILLSTIFVNILVLAVPLYTMNVYDRVLPDFDQATLLVLFLGVLIALVFDLILKILRSTALINLTDHASFEIESLFFENIIEKSNYSQISVSHKLNLFQDLAHIRFFEITKVIPFLFDLPFFLMFLGVVYLISPPLFFVPLIGVILFFCLGQIGLMIVKYYDSAKTKIAQDKINLLLEVFQGFETLKLMHASASAKGKWKNLLLENIDYEKPEQRTQNFLTHCASFIVLMVNVSIVFLGAFEVSENALTIGGLIAISILSSRALAPLSSFVPILSGYQNYQNSKSRLQNFADEVAYNANPQDAISHKNLSGATSLKKISYSYPGQSQPALSNITLDIQKEERIAIVGASGAGKSTLIKVLSGILPAQDGNVLWDTFQLKSVSELQRSHHLGLSSQEDFFFKGTLAENIFMGVNKDFQDNEKHVEQVCFLSGLDLFMRQTGYGWDTPILEKGHNLSTGAKQSISLARAMMHDPKILIFDEPLNGLDFRIEKRLIDHLPNWLKGKTFIMVTHRMSLLPLVENILLLENGKAKTYGPRDKVVEALS